MDIPEAVASSEDLIRWIDQNVKDLPYKPDLRSQLGLGCLDVALELHKAMLLLVCEPIHASAFALLRILFEAWVRGEWLLQRALDEQLEQFKADHHKVTFGQMIEDLESHEAFNNGVLSKVKQELWGMMNSFTHTGYQQVARRNTPDGIVPNYKDEEVIKILGWADAAAIMSVHGIAGYVRNNELSKAALDRAIAISRNEAAPSRSPGPVSPGRSRASNRKDSKEAKDEGAKRMSNLAHLFSLHRYFIWANKMRVHFDMLHQENIPRYKGWDIETRLYMSYWYGGLYVVIEGWQQLKLSDPTIDQLLASPNVPLLRRFRNGTFHFQKNYNDKRFLDFITEGQNVVQWVRKLNIEFGRFFLDNVK